MRAFSPRRPVAVALMLLAATLWSLAGVLTRQVESTRGLELAFWRSLFCALFVAALLAAMPGGRLAHDLRGLLRGGAAVWISGAMWGAMFTFFIVALTFTTVANVLVVCSLGPLFTALLSSAVLREPIPPRTWLAIFAAAAGMAAMFSFGGGAGASGGNDVAGMLLALTIPIAAAINVVTLRKAGAHIDLMPAVLLGALLSVAGTLPFALPFSASNRDIAWLALTGMLQMGLPCLLLVVISRTLTAPEIALLGLLEVVLGPLWAWLGAGERPAAATLTGGVIVLAALASNELATIASRSVKRIE
jgi:drug/metabolite transporter (DMT)-like permease